jgi:hypothetical protein
VLEPANQHDVRRSDPQGPRARSSATTSTSASRRCSCLPPTARWPHST